MNQVISYNVKSFEENEMKLLERRYLTPIEWLEALLRWCLIRDSNVKNDPVMQSLKTRAMQKHWHKQRFWLEMSLESFRVWQKTRINEIKRERQREIGNEIREVDTDRIILSLGSQDEILQFNFWLWYIKSLDGLSVRQNDSWFSTLTKSVKEANCSQRGPVCPKGWACITWKKCSYINK